jgi:branched-chain amino acid transport system ATP-binding protein
MAADIILETSALTKGFSGFRAVNNVNLRVRAATIHALTGPNGADKTICFNLITNFLQPTAGTIRFKGEDITLRFRHAERFLATAPLVTARH